MVNHQGHHTIISRESLEKGKGIGRFEETTRYAPWMEYLIDSYSIFPMFGSFWGSPLRRLMPWCQWHKAPAHTETFDQWVSRLSSARHFDLLGDYRFHQQRPGDVRPCEWRVTRSQVLLKSKRHAAWRCGDLWGFLPRSTSWSTAQECSPRTIWTSWRWSMPAISAVCHLICEVSFQGICCWTDTGIVFMAVTI